MNSARHPGSPRIVVFGNEKGGTGKSTLAMHLTVSLLNRGLKVATIDLDARQGTLSRYVNNRRLFAERHTSALPMPTHIAIAMTPGQSDELEVTRALDTLRGNAVIVIDTPGHDSSLSQAGHTFADVLVTPVNDSLIDLDVLAHVDPAKQTISRPSHYAERVWKAKQTRAARDGGTMDWVVVRNRLGQLAARNKRLMGDLLAQLAKRIGFRLAEGIFERVVYRELFLDGLTVEDLATLSDQRAVAMSHVAARQEMRNLMHALGLPEQLEAPMVSTARGR
jgi:chromosome partitioning protein